MARLWVLAWIPLAATLPPLSRPRQSFVLVMCSLSGLLAVAALAGWLFERGWLTGWISDLPTMKFNTALAVLCISVALARMVLEASGPLARALALAPWVTVTLMAVTLVQYAVDVDLRIDNLIVSHPAAGPHPVGRPAPATAMALLLIALAALAGPPRLLAARRAAAALAFVIGYIASIGLLLEVKWASGLGVAFADVSLPTAASIVMLGATAWSLLQWQVTGADDNLPSSPGARFLRGAMPVAVVLPAAVMWLQNLAHQRGWWDGQVATVLAVAMLASTLWLLALRSARWIDALEAELRQSHRLLEQRVDERTAQLNDAAARLRASQTQLAAVVEGATVAIVTLDERFRVVMFNHEAERVFGVTAGDMIGQPLDRLLPEPARAPHAKALERFARTGETLRRMGGEAKLFGLHADGHEFPIAASISRVELPQGALLFTVVLRDLTDTLALEEERAARHAAELASRSKSMLLSQVSHELRTPLNAVLGFAQLLRAQVELQGASTRLDYLQHIETAGRQLNALIGDLLDLSRAEVGAMALALEPVDFATALREAAAMVGPLATRRAIALHVDSPATAVLVLANRRRLLQVTTNLLSNAIKYNAAAGRVSASFRQFEREIALDVVDSGDGMSDEQLAHLFEPFNRLGRERGPVSGTGIGLALSRKLVVAMGGHIEVVSRPGHGTRVTVRLQRAGASPSVMHSLVE